jgi:hypothetical protein
MQRLAIANTLVSRLEHANLRLGFRSRRRQTRTKTIVGMLPSSGDNANNGAAGQPKLLTDLPEGKTLRPAPGQPIEQIREILPLARRLRAGRRRQACALSWQNVPSELGSFRLVSLAEAPAP